MLSRGYVSQNFLRVRQKGTGLSMCGCVFCGKLGNGLVVEPALRGSILVEWHGGLPVGT
jgi:hypothetical protein